MSSSAPREIVLEARGLVKSYGGRRVVDGLGLRLHARSVLGLLGPNGAGKTTSLRMLYGYLEPEAGTVHVLGRDLATERTEVKRSIGVCTQDDTLDQDLTVRQNLEVYATYFRPRIPDAAARVTELLREFDLEKHAGDRPDTLSGGFKRRVLVARSIVHRPRVLFLDEPTTGLDPKARVDVWTMVRRLRDEGLGVVLTTHYMDEAEKLSDELVVLAHGRDVASGAPADVLGGLVGEQVAVVRGAEQDAVAGWVARELGRTAFVVLDQLLVPVRAGDLARLAAAFPAVQLELRPPNLDDLFLQLSVEPGPHARSPADRSGESAS